MPIWARYSINEFDHSPEYQHATKLIWHCNNIQVCLIEVRDEFRFSIATKSNFFYLSLRKFFSFGRKLSVILINSNPWFSCSALLNHTVLVQLIIRQNHSQCHSPHHDDEIIHGPIPQCHSIWRHESGFHKSVKDVWYLSYESARSNISLSSCSGQKCQLSGSNSRQCDFVARTKSSKWQNWAKFEYSLSTGVLAPDLFCRPYFASTIHTNRSPSLQSHHNKLLWQNHW